MTQADPNTTQAWTVPSLAGLAAFSFGLTGMFLAMEAVILPSLVLELTPSGAKNTFLGGLGFAGMLGAALVQPIAGWYSDRTSTALGRRVPFIIWSTIFVTLGLSGLVVADDYWSLVILWLFIQVNASIGFGPFHALIRDLVPTNRIGVASSLKILADGAGGVTLVAITGLVMSRYTGPEAGIWLGMALAVIAVAVIGSGLVSSYTVVTRERAYRYQYHRAVESLRHRSGLHPQLPWYLVSRYLLVTAVITFPTYGLFFLDDVVGVTNPARTLGLMIILIGGAFVLSVYPAGRLSDRIGRKPVVVGGSLAAAAATLSMLLAGNQTEVLIVASLMGCAVGVVLSASWAMANDLGTEGRAGQHMGIVNLATIGGAASAKLLGPGVDLLNLAGPGLGYSVLLAGSAALFLIAALLILPVDPHTAPAP